MHTSLDLEHGGRSTHRSQRFAAHTDFDSQHTKVEDTRTERLTAHVPCRTRRRYFADNVLTASSSPGDALLTNNPHGLSVAQLRRLGGGPALGFGIQQESERLPRRQGSVRAGKR